MARELSAGLLVFRRKPDLQVLLAHPGGPFWANKDERAWSIPKGLLEPGDDLLAAARREFAEETGIAIEGKLVPLAPVRSGGKEVHAFAVEADPEVESFRRNEFEMEWPPKSGKRRTFPEVDRIAWYAIDAALNKVHAYQRPLLEELRARFG